jgi:hypothetical protein
LLGRSEYTKIWQWRKRALTVLPLFGLANQIPEPQRINECNVSDEETQFLKEIGEDKIERTETRIEWQAQEQI